MNDVKYSYVSPQCEIYSLATEGVLCASGEWYNAPGHGSFDYGVDDDDDFGW